VYRIEKRRCFGSMRSHLPAWLVARFDAWLQSQSRHPL